MGCCSGNKVGDAKASTDGPDHPMKLGRRGCTDCLCLPFFNCDVDMLDQSGQNYALCPAETYCLQDNANQAHCLTSPECAGASQRYANSAVCTTGCDQTGANQAVCYGAYCDQTDGGSCTCTTACASPS